MVWWVGRFRVNWTHVVVLSIIHVPANAFRTFVALTIFVGLWIRSSAV